MFKTSEVEILTINKETMRFSKGDKAALTILCALGKTALPLCESFNLNGVKFNLSYNSAGASKFELESVEYNDKIHFDANDFSDLCKAK